MAPPSHPKWMLEGDARRRGRRASSHDRLLAHANELFMGGSDLAPSLDAIARLVVPRLGDACVIDVIDEDGHLARSALAATTEEETTLLEEMRSFPPAVKGSHPATEVLRTGRPVVLDRLGEAELRSAGVDLPTRERVRRLGISSTVSVPITARGRILGVISFAMCGPNRTHAPEDVQFAERLGRHAGLALDNARLYGAERRARQEAEATAARLTRIERLTSALAEALTPEQVARTVLNHAVQAFGAQAGSVLRLNDASSQLEILATEGYPSQVGPDWGMVPLDHPSPLPQAVRTGQPVIIPDRASWERDFPDVPRVHEQAQALLALPLLVQGRAIGALSLTLDEPRSLTEADRSLLTAVADQCAQALDRAELYEAERTAREALERANARLRLLADAQRQFVDESHDCHSVLDAIATRLADEIGDACAIRMLAEGGEWFEPPTLHHRDPAMDAALQSTAGSVRARAHAGVPGQVLATGRPMRVPQLDLHEVELRFAPELHPVVRRFPVRSMMVAPLRGHGEVFGVIEMTRYEPDHPYGEEDLLLLDQLAQRAGVAITKARLLEAERVSRARAEEAVRMRDDYLATITHDLRTPLNTVSMGTILLEQELPEGDPCRRHVASIRRGIDNMDQLIEDLLDLSRLERGAIRLGRQPVDVRDLLSDTRELLAPHAADRGQSLELRVEGPPGLSVDCDRKRIAQVLSNLVANAIKFTPEGGAITVGARAVDGGSELYVSDTGPGLTEDVRAHMFDRYWTAGDVSRRTGLGLGLSIVRGLVEAHDAQIDVDSEPERGTTFRFRLPAAS